jgi:hypothetical protein
MLAHYSELISSLENCHHKVPSYQFKISCRWSELPGGSLLITGGGDDAVRKVVRIDTLREYAVSSQPPMHTPRHNHAAVYHSQYLYVLGGYNEGRYLSECERYLCAESQWEVLPALPIAGEAMIDGSLRHCSEVETRQPYLAAHEAQASLSRLQLPLLQEGTEVYLVIKKTLYSFTPLKPIKILPKLIECRSSYYSRGTLYYERGRGIKFTRL